MDTVNESLTTVEDGDTTVNERLSTGGEGPEGQPDTVTESLSGAEPTDEPATPVEDDSDTTPKRRKRS